MKDSIHIAAAGLGVNTVAYIIECTKQGIIFDAVLFSDPGKEHTKTYEYIPILNKWLLENGQPEITILYNLNKDKEFVGIYNDLINNRSLPSIAYGFKTCSQKWKSAPADKFLNNWEPSAFAFKNGIQVYKYLGYDADESHRIKKDYINKKYINVHPLVELNMGRFECVESIIDAGLPLPPKSSCTFCPSMKPWEIIDLYENEPKEFYDAVRMERNALSELTSIKGLGRDWSWWDLIVAYRYLRIIKKHKSVSINIPQKIERLMKKVNNSRPIDYEKLSKERNAKAAVCDLFRQSIEIPCECISS